MSYKYNKKIFIFLFLLACCASCIQVLASYDVVKAVTVGTTPTEEIKFNDAFEQYHANTQDVPQVQNDFVTNISNKIKNLFMAKTQQDEIDEFDYYEIEDEVKEEDNKTESEVKQTQKPQFYEEKQEVKDDYKFQINADKIAYDDENGNVIATGNVEIIAKAQEVKLKAQNAILDKEAQLLKLSEDVRIIKGGTEMKGESLIVDLNEENILMDNPTLEAYSFLIQAQEGYLIANDIQALNGVVKATQKKEFPLVTRGFMRLDSITRNPFFDKVLFPEDDINSSKKQSYKIDSKEIVITSYKDHNALLLKGSNIYYNNHKIVRNSDIEIISDKKQQIVETNMPEAGNLRNFGTYIGYGIVKRLPQGHTLKFMPVIAYGDSDVGVGAIARYRARHGVIDGGWNTASDNLVVRGKYNFANNLGFNFGRNAYMPEGFMGARRSGYAAQLQYAKSFKISDLNATFSNGVYAGIFSDYQKHDQEDAYSTTRFRYMAQLTKNVKRYKNKEQSFIASLDASAQGAATVYGSGETHGIIRVGPQLTTRVKRWESVLGYYITGEHGQSPFLFDLYRYGKSTITINEKFHFNDKVALGVRMFVTPMKDNYENDLLTECRFYLIAGPKDAKVALSYDFVRDIAHFNFMFLIGSDNSSLSFNKLTTKDMDGGAQKRDFYKNAKRIKIEKPENI